MIAEWIRRLRFTGVGEKKTRQLAGAVIGCQAFVLFFFALVAWGLDHSRHPDGGGNATTLLWVGIALAVLCLYSSASMRKPLGIPLGWVLQAATLLTAFIVPSMLVVGLVFLALWITALVQGDKMDELTRNFMREYS